MTAPARLLPDPDDMAVTLTVGQLKALVTDALLAIRPAELVDSAEVARLLKVKASTVPTLVKREGLPFVRVGRQYRFRVTDVVAWAEERMVRPGAHHRRHGAVVRELRRR